MPIQINKIHKATRKHRQPLTRTETLAYTNINTQTLEQMSEYTGLLAHRDNGTRHCHTGTGTHRLWDTDTEGHIEPGAYIHH